MLQAVTNSDSYANLVLPVMLRERQITGRDAAFATELAYGVLRAKGSYEAITAASLSRGLDATDPAVIDVLSLGVHQLLATRVPDHAAISATVELAREVRGEGAASLVNAVLRRVVEGGDLHTWLERVAPPIEVDLLSHLSVTLSHPRWIIEALGNSLRVQAQLSGAPAPGDAELIEALTADNVAPHVTLTARPGQAELEELLAPVEGRPGATVGRWSPYAAVLSSGGDPGAVLAVREGRAGVQDEGSQLVALLLAGAPLVGSDRAWLDLCAGPGGKAALLAAVAAARGARVVAVELQPHRARLVRSALSATELRHPGTTVTVVADGTSAPVAPGSMDRVLVDAPCTGLGALRRRPEARWRRTPGDVGGLLKLQGALLRSALDAVRPGGVVAYATCSPHVAETRGVLLDVLSRRTDVTELDTAELLDAMSLAPMPGARAGNAVQLWPHRHGTDAMFIALLRKDV